MQGTGLLRGAAARAISTSTLASQALPALAADTPATQGSWISRLLGAVPREGTPLSDPLPGVTEVPPATFPSQPPETQLTTYPNGMKLASEDTPGPSVTLGMFVDTGSVYEFPDETGLSHLLEYMAFKTTKHRTHFRVVREIESIGGNVLASASREQMVYNLDVVKPCVPQGLGVLADAVLFPAFADWEVAAAIEKMAADVKAAKDNPQSVLLDGIHEVAYKGALARPLLCPESALAGLSADKLRAFHARNFTPPRMVLAAAGLSHAQLKQMADELLGGLPTAPASPAPASTYVGGDFRQFSASGMTHIMLGFEFAGGWKDIKGSVAVTALQFLMGGGGSFSAGGPGKGMHSRLYTRVLNKHAWMHNCTAFNSLYNDTGIVGVFASAESAHAEEAVDVLTREMLAVAKDVPVAELERAKKAAISSVLMNLESRAVVAEDIGRQVLTYGHRKPVAEFIGELRALKPKDITAVVGKMLKSPISVASIGDITDIPRYDSLSKRFG